MPLRFGELTRLELRIAECASLLVRRRGLDLPLQLTQLLEGLAASGARLAGILPSQIAGGAPHLLRDVAHALARVRALSRLSGLAGLTLLGRAALTGLTLLTLAA